MGTGIADAGIDDSDGRVVHAVCGGICGIFECSYHMCAYDGEWDKRLASVYDIAVPAMCLLYIGWISAVLVDACEGKTFYRVFDSGIDRHGLYWCIVGMSGKSAVDEMVLNGLFLLKIKIFLSKISQYLERTESENSRCCDLLCKSVPEWGISGKNMFDFMENWGYNVGTQHFFGDKVPNDS